MSRAITRKHKLPDFIAVGPPRTGTSWLDQTLRGHVGLPEGIKETQFFKWHYNRGIDWYAAHFRNCPADLRIGEICPVYFDFAPARTRIKEHIPDCKIICVLREPIERLYSHYKMMRPFAGFQDFEHTLAEVPGFADSSRYAQHLKAWQDSFGKENVLVLLYDDLEADPQAFLDQVCSFVGIPPIKLAFSQLGKVDPWGRTNAPKSRLLAFAANRLFFWLVSHRMYRVLKIWQRSSFWSFCFAGGDEYGPMREETRARLQREFLVEIEALEQLLGRNLSAWQYPASSVASRKLL